MQIILLCGKARSGKDTVADFLFDEYKKNKKPCKLQVAQYLKYYVMKYFGWDGSDETKPRDFLNTLGTDIIRNKVNKDFHINRLIEDIEVLSYYYDTFIVSDVRFPSEISKIKEKFDNVTVVKVFRDSDVLSEEQKKQVTETALDDYDSYDYVLDNSHSLDDLRLKAIELYNEIGDVYE